MSSYLYHAVVESLNTRYLKEERSQLITTLVLCKDHIKDRGWLIKLLCEAIDYYHTYLKQASENTNSLIVEKADLDTIRYNYLNSLNSLSILYADIGEPDKSIQLDRTILSIASKYINNDSRKLYSQLLCLSGLNLSVRLNQCGQNKEALVLLDSLFSEFQNLPHNFQSGIFHLDVITNRTIVLMDLLEMQEATSCIESGLQLCDELMCIDPMTFGIKKITLKSLQGTIDANLLNTHQAKLILDEAVSQFALLCDSGIVTSNITLLMASSLASIATAFLKIGEIFSSLKISKQALEIYQNYKMATTHVYDVDSAKVKLVYLQGLFILGRNDEIGYLLDETLENFNSLNQKYGGVFSLDISRCLSIKATIASEVGEAKNSYDYFQMAVESLSDYPDKLNVNYLQHLSLAHTDMARFLVLREDYEEALFHLHNAEQALAGSPEKSIVILNGESSTLHLKTTILLKLGKEKEASALCVKLLHTTESLFEMAPNSLVVCAMLAESLLYSVICEQKATYEKIVKFDELYCLIRDYHDAEWVKSYPAILTDIINDGYISRGSREEELVLSINNRFPNFAQHT